MLTLRDMAKERSKQATIRDVARLAGVAPITASRALQKPDMVKEKTRLKVRKAADELSYIPNLVAGMLASNVSNMVAVIVPNLSNSIFADTLQSIAAVLRPQGYHLLIGHCDYSSEQEEELLRTFLSRRADAVVLTGLSHSEGTRALIRSSRVPTVEMWSVTDQPLGVCVGISNHDAAYSMTRYLIGKGRRNIGFIGGHVQNNDRAQSRLQGYLDALAEHGLPADDQRIAFANFEYHDGARAMNRLLEADPALDAVFAASDVLATGALQACLRRNVKVPETVAIAGMDDAGIAQVMTPALTTISVPRQEIGRKVAEVILSMLRGEQPASTVFDMGFQLVERDTT